MVVQFTYPLLDTRRILDPRRDDLVHAPNWFELWDKEDDGAYVRRIGKVVERPSTGKLKLPMESLCVDAFRKLDADEKALGARPIFFRLFWDSAFACRADVGFKIVHAPPNGQTELLQRLARGTVTAFGLSSDLIGLGAVIAPILGAATDLAGKGQDGILATKPSIFVQLPYNEVGHSDLLDGMDEFMEDSVKGLAENLRFAPSYQKRFEVARLAANARLPFESSAGRKKISVWVLPERRVLRKAALDPEAIARHMRITIAKLESEREVLQAASDAAKKRPEIARAVLTAVEATIERVAARPFSRPGIATNDASYGAALMTKAFTVERYFATNQYHKLELYRQQTLAAMRQECDLLTTITAERDVNIAIYRGPSMSDEKPSIQFGDFHAGRDVNSQVGDNNRLETGASASVGGIKPEDWAMLAETLPKLQAAILASGTDSDSLKMATKVAEASEAAKKKDEKGVLDNLKAVGGKLLDVAEKVGTPILTAWLKLHLGF